MMRFVVCFLICVCRGVYGSMADEMAETTQLCCNQGTAYARNHTSSDCSSSVPPDVPSAFGSICLFAMDQCCKEYFQKKRDCDGGIEMALSGNRCNSRTDSIQNCCDQCMKGTESASRGVSACEVRSRGSSAEDLLPNDAFTHCCKKASKEDGGDSHAPQSPVTSSTVASLCEEYAPNELCAHHCIPIPGSYKCQCNPGFMLMADGKNCMEVVTNRCKPRNPCQHKCNDNGIEVKCSCRRGYQLMSDGRSCEDIDECHLDPPVCLPGTQCSNIQGSYKCIPVKRTTNTEKGQCPPGFAKNLNNNACDDINECQLPNPPCPSYLCENTVGGYKCGGMTGDPAYLPNRPVADDRCPPGFRIGVNEECEDVDECSLHKDDCNPLSEFCINTRGSYYCQMKGSKYCKPGFKIDPRTGKCEDINECEDEEDGQDICRPDQICINVPGEYDCKPKEQFRATHNCPEGMRMKPGSSICEDIDECVEGTHLCDHHQTCLNTNGSHECYCKIGYEHDPTTGACIDVNECATGQHNCISGSQRCDNTVGSFLCVRFTSCGTGYILHHATSQCEDVDECALGTHNCDRAGPDFQCENHPGGFRCVRKHRSTSSTTSTTPVPEYEYEYYYSEEETDDNKTETSLKPSKSNPEPEVTTTTTSEPPRERPTTPTSNPVEPVPETPRELPRQLDPEDDKYNYVEPPINVPRPEEKPGSVDSRQPEQKQPETTSQPESPRTNYAQPEEQPTKPESPPIEQPEPEEPQERYSTEDPRQTEPPRPYEPPQPERKPYEEQRPYIPPQKEQKTYYEPTPDQPNINNSIEPEPRRPEPAYTVDYSSPTPPHVVFVNVGRETATVQGEKTKDGAVIVNTEDVPKNEWTGVNEKPSDCQVGFEMDDYGACYDIDECATNRHSCSGLTETCRNTMGGYLCDCAQGFRRDLVTGACDFITTSSTSTTTSTSTSTTTSTTSAPVTVATTPDQSKNYFWGYLEKPITNRPFRPRTLCDVGYHLNSQTGRCDDVNECTNGQANCAAVEICVNTEGGYRCECPPNWRLDDIRHRCVPIRNNGQFPSGYGNEPVYPPVNVADMHQVFKGKQFVDPQVTQVEDRGSIISCPTGYKLGYDNTCEDINECLSIDSICGAMQCTNLPGGYVCSCPAGHKLVQGNRCEDVDECSLGGNMPICSQNADCVNTAGSYQCRCHTGFRSAPINDKVCVDVDECTESPSGSLCQQRCNNVWGGYRCSCHRGYRLNPDNRTCSDVDECSEFKSKIPCIGRCVNEPGSYRCTCPHGYRLSADKRSCIDIDECETGEAPCAKGGTYGGSSDVCLNTRGGYRCHRITCPPGYKLENKHRCTRIEKICPPADWDCAHQPTTYSYNFITFVSKLYIPASKVDLFTMRGPMWANAKMRFQLRLVDVNAPPSVKDKADINSFLLVQTGNQAVMSLVRSLEGPQSIELELSMELYNGEQFGGIAVARLYIYVSEYEF